MQEEEKRLKDRNINPTAMRLLVLQHLMEREQALSLKDLEKSFHRADKSTLYRTLKTFEERRLIHRIDDGSGSVKYALCYEDCDCSLSDMHYHFHCQECNATFCLNTVEIPKVELPPGFKMTQANFVLQGVCANCSASC